jgi:hypothetical protein
MTAPPHSLHRLFPCWWCGQSLRGFFAAPPAYEAALRLFQRNLRSLVWVWVWDWVPTSPCTLLHALPFFSPSAELVRVWVWVWDWVPTSLRMLIHALPFFGMASMPRMTYSKMKQATMAVHLIVEYQ